MKTRKILAACLMFAAVVGAAHGAAVTIFQDDFSGSAGAGLHGTTPDVTTGGATWTAHANIKADGSVTAAPEGSSAWLPLAATPGKIYELSAEFDSTGSWLSMGFATGAGETARILDTAVLWGLVQETGSAHPDQSFTGPGTAGGEDEPTTSADTLKVVLNTTGTVWEVEWYFNGTLERTATVSPASITHVYLSATSGTTGSYDNFLLTYESPLASNPAPAKDGTGVSLDAGLSWDKSTDGNVTKHYLYFSDTSDLSGIVPVEVTDLVDPITTNPPIALQYNTTYYWRVDESIDNSATNDPATLVGEVWSFETVLDEPVILFQDDFSGSAAAGLHETPPDIAPSGTTWTAHAGIKADGSVTAASEGSSAWLPLVATPGKIYELSADFDNTGNWLSMGFAIGAGTTARILDTGALWGLVRKTSSTYTDQTFFDLNGGTENGVDESTTSAGSMKVVLDTTAADWAVEWYLDGGLERSETIAAASIPSITHVYLSSTSGAAGSYDNFLMTVYAERASNPYPAAGATDVLLPDVLGWDKSTVSNVTKHYLYIAEDTSDLSGVIPVEVTDLDDPITTASPITLQMGHTYYWRVDESVGNSATNAPETIVGETWSFSTFMGQTATLFQDDFSGSSGDGLHGTTPDVAPSGTTWAAHTGIKADGSVTAAAEGSSAWLPFVPESGKIYQLSATLDAYGNWMSMGFAIEDGTTARILDNAVLWDLIREDGSSDADQTFFDLDGGTGNGENESTSSANALRIVLDTRNLDWEVEWYFDGLLERTETISQSQTPSITHVYLSSTSGASGDYDDFLLTETISAVLPATIMDWSAVSGSIMKMVVDTPVDADRYHPEYTADLVTGSFSNTVAHSTNGVDGFAITNLGYSAVDGNGYRVIYVDITAGDEGFYSIVGE